MTIGCDRISENPFNPALNSNKLKIVSEFDTNVIIQSTVNNIHSNCKNIRLTSEISIIILIELYQDKFICVYPCPELNTS